MNKLHIYQHKRFVSYFTVTGKKLRQIFFGTGPADKFKSAVKEICPGRSHALKKKSTLKGLNNDSQERVAFS